MNTSQVQAKKKETSKSGYVCSARHVYLIDNFLRPLIHNPRKLFGPYVRPGMRVLDIGCGRGFASLGLARLVGEKGLVVSADLQPEMLCMVSTRAEKAELSSRIRLHQCQPDRVGLEENFDFVLAFWMAHETPDPTGFLNEVYTLLKPEGRFLLIEPKMHISAKVFNEFVVQAQEIGFTVSERPSIRLSRAAVLQKNRN